MFEVYVEVSHRGTVTSDADALHVLKPDEGAQYPEVRRQFPEDYSDQEVLQTLTKFCFPFCVDSLTVSQVGQNFTFVLTDIDSKQRFGFCRLSSGAKNCFCILSYLPWFEVFYKLLNILADYTIKGHDSPWKELLETLHNHPVPNPGVPVSLSVHSHFTVPDYRELPSIPENRNLTEYIVAVDINNMLHLYASMLYERRILICCSKLSTLTACVHGSAAMLYPMFWQHVYIPVLPPHLLDYCCAPMPYLIGVHSSLMEKVKSMALDDVVLLNVDTNTLETPFDDLQSLPNDVVSSLKNRLKKVSTTTGDGVARAFLKAQASLFGSYRSALKIEPEEPITFCEETFVAHRSSAMRLFLQNAIQLQLFKQFIDGRLELLNSGKGFSDIFEEEINMGEYAGSDKLYYQWLVTVKKGSGAIIHTVRTKANPAMKTVYKFAKDHARMGIKEVKNRLKQKDFAENGYAAATEDSQQRAVPSPLVEKKEVKQRDDRRPITVHFGQARPPRPQIRRPKSNAAVEGRRTSVSSPEHVVRPTRHYTVFLSEDSSDDDFHQEEDSVSGFSENFLFSTPFEWPQPYKTLKETGGTEGEDMLTVDGDTVGNITPPSPTISDRMSGIDLLEDSYSVLEVELPHQPLTQAKSLEDLRTPKDDDGEQRGTFDYQRMELNMPERNKSLPGINHLPPYNKLWSMGQDDMALSMKSSINSSERHLKHFGGGVLSVSPRPPSEESLLTFQDKENSGTGIQSSITIPRPQGRKTPELGIVPPPPAMRVAKQQSVLAETSKTLSVAELLQEPYGSKRKSTDPEYRPSPSYSSQASQPFSGSSPSDVLKPTKVGAESISTEDLLSLLDPLSSSSSACTTETQPSLDLQRSTHTLESTPANFLCGGTEFVSPFGQHLGYSSSSAPIAPFSQTSLNPFTQTAPSALQIPLPRPSGSQFVSPTVSMFNTNYIPPNHAFFRPQRNFSAPSLSNVFSQPSTLTPSVPFLQHSQTSSQNIFMQPASATPSTISVLQMSSVSHHRVDAIPAIVSEPVMPPLTASKSSKGIEKYTAPPKAEDHKDPFEDLLNKTKQEVAPVHGNVEQLRKRWETFE
ncbi:DENN domain-containing protein 1A isoform X2 [Protopterus annectens]|uniref:DENN domain-containing protein 1A isoform X2 n=1 Tax=Protopterus annectens TaxID=7888 RepID=UPI001CFA6C21|nr:DENN domain-containing protein 1A isoform X2 [Protopterus annectens]